MQDDLFEQIEEFLRSDTKETKLLSEEDIQTLIMSLAIHRGEDGFTEEEAVALIRWAETQLIGESMVRLVLKGFAWVDHPTGKFDEDTIIGLTEYGLAMRAKLT